MGEQSASVLYDRKNVCIRLQRLQYPKERLEIYQTFIFQDNLFLVTVTSFFR